MNCDEVIATYITVDYNNRGDIKGKAHYVNINGKLLLLGFKPFYSMYFSLRLIPMTIVKFPSVSTKKGVQKKNYYNS